MKRFWEGRHAGDETGIAHRERRGEKSRLNKVAELFVPGRDMF